MSRIPLVLLVLLIGCQQEMPPPTAALTTAEVTLIEEEVTAVLNEMISAAEATEDINDLIVHWLDDYHGASNGEEMNKEKMISMMGPGFENLESQDFDMTVTNIDVLSPEAVALNAFGVFTSTDIEGTTYPERSLAWTFVFVKSDGEWKILQSHQSFKASS